MFEKASAGGAQACGIASGSIQVGQRADFVALDTEHPLLVGRSKDELLDSWIFSGNSSVVQDVFVAGKQLIDRGQHPMQNTINQRFRETIKELMQ